ncbi:glycosyltransferase family 2 protein [Psychrobacter alimentarius]|uniref:glycosyltransferase family 2 protein n=1 Tax=Psychrobacter alimentarius TaxID=261164 RepID=UPI003FD0239D
MNTIKEPLVSVIVPVYNVENYIDDCLNSIKQQTYKNLEIIVVEDCSTDSSREAIDFHLMDERIKIIQHKKNGGLSAARNTGIDFATGEYMMFVDSDDIIDERLVAACVKYALKMNTDVVTYGFIPFKDGIAEMDLPFLPNSLELKPTIIKNAYFNLPHFAWLKFIRASTVKSASLNFPVGLYYEDWPFHWNLGLLTEVRCHLSADFYLYRQRGASITGSTGKELLDLFIIHSEVASILQRHPANEVQKIFANKVRQSHWSILTRIDSEYLAIALKKAKEAKKILRLNEYEKETNFKNILISKIVNMPSQLALYSLKLLRILIKERARFQLR